MSTTIDSKVVEMKFDNQNFENNVKTSLTTLEKLKQALKLDNAATSFEAIEKASEKVNLDSLANATETVSLKFDALQVAAITALTNIVNAAVDAGVKLVKSLSVDNIAAGWRKFEDTTTSVGTLISQGYDMSTVSQQLDRLNTYTDETSYTFTEMVKNIGKFTAAGQDLESSVTAMEGIANWAALSGQNAVNASRAMYTLSQAIGMGYMRYYNYRMIQNASMDTSEFRQIALETATELGTLKKVAEDTYEVIGHGGTFTKSNFTSLLTKGWFNSDVIMATLNKYSAAFNQIADYAEKNGITITEVISSIGELAEEKGISVDDAIKELGMDFNGFALKAFKAAQEARTLSDALGAVKEAVSSSWSKTFEHIFGNYEEAKKLWTDLVEELWDVFVESGKERNKILFDWKQLGGRTALIDAFWNSFYSLLDIINAVKEAFYDVFPKATGKRLYEITIALRDFTEKAKLSDEQIGHIMSILSDFFSIIRVGVGALQAFADGLYPIFDLFNTGGDAISDLDAILTDFTDTLTVSIKRYHVFEEITYRVSRAVSELVGYLKALVESGLGDFLVGARKHTNFLEGLFYALGGAIGNVIRLVFNMASALTGIDFSGIRDKILGIFAGMWISLPDIFANILESIKNNVEKFIGPISTIFDSAFNGTIVTDFAGFVDKFAKASTDFFSAINMSGVAKAAVEGLKFIFESIMSFLGAPVWGNIAEFIKGGGLIIIGTGIYEFVEELAAIRKTINIGELLQSVADTLAVYQKNIKSKTILNIAEAILMLAIALTMLSKIPTYDMAAGLIALAAVFVGLMIVLGKMQKMLSLQNLSGLTTISLSILMMAGAILFLALAIDRMKNIPMKDIGKGLIAVASSIGILGTAAFLLKNTAPWAINAAKAMIPMAVAMNLLVVPIALLGLLNMEHISRGIAALAGSLFSMTLALMALSSVADGFSKLNVIKMAGSFAVFAAVLWLIVPPLFALAGISSITGALGPAVGALAATISVMTVALMALSVVSDTISATNMAAISVALIALAVALNIMIIPVTALGTMNPDTWLQGFLSIIGLVSLLIVTMCAFSTTTPMVLSASASCILLSMALTSLVAPLELLGHMDLKVWEAGFVRIAGLLAVMTVALWGLNLCSPNVIAAAAALTLLAGAFLVMAVAVDVLIPAVIDLGKNLNSDQLTAGVLSVLGLLLGMTVIAVAGTALILLLSKLLVPAIPVLFNAAGALALFALALLALVAPLLLLTVLGTEFASSFIETLRIFAESSAEIVDSLIIIAESVTRAIVAFLGMLLTGFLEGIEDFTQPLIDVILKILIDILVAIDDNLQVIIELVLEAVVAIIEGIAAKVEDICKAVVDLVIAIIDAIADTLCDPEVAQRIKDSLDHLAIQIWESFKTFFGIHSPSTKMEWFGSMLIAGMKKGLKNAWENLWNDIKRVGEFIRNVVDKYIRGFPEILGKGVEELKDNMHKGFNEIRTDLSGIGKFFGLGFSDGLEEGEPEVVEAVSGFANKSLETLRKIFQIHSPSEKLKEIAEMFGQGFFNGINGLKDKAKGVVSGFGDSALSGLTGMYDMYFDAGKNSGLSFIDGWQTSFRSITGKMTKDQHIFGADYAIEQAEKAREAMIRQANEELKETDEDISEDLNEQYDDMTNTVNDIVDNKTSGKTSGKTSTASAVKEDTNEELNNLKEYLDQLEILYNRGLLTEEQYHRNRLILLENYKGEWDKTTSGWLKNEREWCAEHGVTTNEMMDAAVASVKAMKEVMENTYTSFTENFDKLLEDYQNGLITLEEYDKKYRKLLLDSALVGDKAQAYARSKTSEYVQTLFEPINEEFENEIANIQSKMSSYSDNMRGAIKDAFEIKTNRDIYDETIDSYNKKITELEEKRDKAIEIYGENHWYVKQIQSQIDDINKESEKYQKEYADSGVKDDDIASINFTDKLAEDTKALEEYNKSLSKLMGRGIMPDLREMVAGMSIDEGKAFVEYLNGLTDAELQNIQDQWTKKKEESDKLSATLYQSNIDAVIAKYETDITDLVNSLPPEMHAAGVEAMKELGAGFSEATNDTLEIFGQTMFDIKTEAMRMVDEEWAKQWAVMIANSAPNVLDSIGSLDATIKPILDLSEMEKEMKRFQNMLNELKTDSGTVYITAGYINQFQEPPEWWEKSRQSTDNSIYTLGQKVDMGFEHVIGAIDDADVQVVLDSNAVSGMANRIIGKLVISKTRGS